MENQNQAEDFDRSVSRTSGDMFPVNGHLNGSDTKQKSPEPQKAPSAPARIPPVAPLEQKVPVPTQSVPFEPQNPPPLAAKVPPVVTSELERQPLATHSVAVSKVCDGEARKLQSASSSVISAELHMLPSVPSSAISAQHEKPASAATIVTATELERPQPVTQKPESSKVINGVAVKPAEGIKNGHAVGAGKDVEDDDSDVIIMKSPDAISSSSEEVVAEGKTTGAATDEAQRAGKPLSFESQFMENRSFETKANTAADIKDFQKKQERKEADRKEDLKNIDGKILSGKEGKDKEDKEEESPKKEQSKDEEMMRTAAEVSWKKEPEKIVEKNEKPESKQMENETAMKKESLNAALDVSWQAAGMSDDKPTDKREEEEETCKNTAQGIKEIQITSEESVKKEADKGNNKREVVCSNKELPLKEQKDNLPENAAKINEKELLKIAEKEVKINEGFEKKEAKSGISSNLRESDTVRTGDSSSVDAEVIKNGPSQLKDESKDEKLGESYKKLVEETKKESPKKEEGKQTERREEALTNEIETETLNKSSKEKVEETVKGWPKKEGREIEKLEDSSKKAVEEIKDSPKKENKNEIERIENSFRASSEGSKRELPKEKAETLIVKEEQLLKHGEEIQEKKEEIEIVKKAEFLKEETKSYVEEKVSTKETEKRQPEEKESEKKVPMKDAASPYSVKGEILRPGSVSPAPVKSTTPKKSKSTTESEPTTSKKTTSTPEPPTSAPKDLTAKTTPGTEGEKSPRTKTPKDLGESKPKRRFVKKRDSQSQDEVAKRQGNDTAASITIKKDLLVCRNS
jgi:hypothetical protein